MYDGQLNAQFNYTLEGIGWSILSSKITVGCHFNEERNANTLCLHANETDIVEKPAEMASVEEVDTGGHGHLCDQAGMS